MFQVNKIKKKKMSDVTKRVTKVIVDKVEKDPEEIKSETRFVEDLGLDSLARVELMMSFEEEFKDLSLEIPDDAAEKIKTVGDAIDYIQSVIQND